MKAIRIILTVNLLCIMTLTSSAQVTMKDYSIPGIYQNDFVSKINGQPYRPTVTLPFANSSVDTTHYPVMYMLDGDPNPPLAALIQWRTVYFIFFNS